MCQTKLNNPGQVRQFIASPATERKRRYGSRKKGDPGGEPPWNFMKLTEDSTDLRELCSIQTAGAGMVRRRCVPVSSVAMSGRLEKSRRRPALL